MSAAYWPWVALYLMVPVVGIAVARAYNSRKQESLSKLFEGQTLLFSVGAILLLLVFWPLVCVGLALDPWIAKLGYWRDARRNRFQCRPEHLSGSVTVEDAEASGKVVDPLHRVPDLPFGHLNPVWRGFLKQRRFGYRLKSFSIPVHCPEAQAFTGTCSATPQGQRLGYAWVGLWSVKAEFIYEWGWPTIKGQTAGDLKFFKLSPALWFALPTFV